MRRSFVVLSLILLPAAARAQGECPAGSQPVASGDPTHPLRCQKTAGGVGGLRGFKEKLRCPPGFKAEETPNSMQKFHCVADASAETDLRPAVNTPAPQATLRPSAFGSRCPSGTVPSEDAAGALQCLPKAPPVKAAPGPGSYKHFRAGTDVEFDYPRDWQVSDGWEDESPTIYIVRDTGQAGKKVSLLVTENKRGQPGYLDMKDAIARDKEMQSAMEGGSGTVAGKYAHFLYVPKESHTAYVQAGPDLYYTLVFSAPESLNKTYKPAYDRLLKSFRIASDSEEQ